MADNDGRKLALLTPYRARISSTFAAAASRSRLFRKVSSIMATREESVYACHHFISAIVAESVEFPSRAEGRFSCGSVQFFTPEHDDSAVAVTVRHTAATAVCLIIFFVFLFNLSFILNISTKKKGTKSMPTVMATSIPKNTPVPMSRLAAEPGPEASTRGTSPSMNASDVITIGRKRNRAAVRAACTTSTPLSTSSFANSTIRMAFFATSPTSITRPIWK